MDYPLKEIRVFVAIMEHGSFKAAARALHLSQPALTQRLQKLEERIGVRLIERSTRALAPTVVGRQFLPIAERMLHQVDRSLADLVDLAAGNTGTVTVSSLISVAADILPGALRRFARERPDIGVRIIDDAEREIVAHVRRGEAEFGIDMQTAAPDPDILATPVLEDPYVLVCHADHPRTVDRPVRWDELDGMALITMGARSGTSRLVPSTGDGGGPGGASRYEVQHISTLIALIEAGLGAGIVPAMSIRARKNDRLVCRRLVEPDLKRTIVFVQRRGVALSPAAERFRDCLLETFADLPPAA